MDPVLLLCLQRFRSLTFTVSGVAVAQDRDQTLFNLSWLRRAWLSPGGIFLEQPTHIRKL
jgi:hypothetical protein